jgi:pSer/pThr/pTyr-binding forkhead associated (FHA) protein
MSVLRTIESKLESLFEGIFGRAFRANVQPVELARKLVKEMDDHRTVSVSRVYVPNEYSIYLSPPDREQFGDFEDSLCDELQDYLAEHARREGYVLLTPPRVKLETDADLDVGVFGIATRLVRGPRPPQDAPAEAPSPGATMVYKAVQAPPAVADEAPEPPQVVRETASLLFDGQKHELTERRAVIGRSKDCDVRVPDPNVSRRHAEVRQEGATFWLVDLDSTNGVEVNGRPVRRLKLEDGTRFTIGSTEVTFTRELA